MDKRSRLRTTTFGRRVAEEEHSTLASYFVETDQWRRIFNGTVDVVRGAKGSGKSAAYLLLQAREADLRERGIVTIAGENPRGTPAFRDLVADPPSTEDEFRNLWKLYLLTLVADVLQASNVRNSHADRVQAALSESGLISESGGLRARVRAALDYVRRVTTMSDVSGTVAVEPTTGTPILTGRISFAQPTVGESESG